MKKKPLGKLGPWVWSVELVRGCNLSCWHYTARVFAKQSKPRFMETNTFEAMCRVMAEKTPYTRLEFAQGGEPTLHPRLLELLSIAREITPTTQIQVTTNGMTLLNEKIKYKDIFDAGANSIYIDMYGDIEKHIEMAKSSDAEWYLYNSPKVGTSNHKMANTYYGQQDMRLIILQNNPEYRLRWRKVGRLSTFFNHIDWEVAIPHGLVPVRNPYKRKCTLPMRYVSLTYEGDYIFCCIDFWGESAGLLGNVKDGPENFEKYWFGELIQSIRRKIVTGDRKDVPYCSRCNCAFSKCDWVKIWPLDFYSQYWNGEMWQELSPGDEIFADGWKKYKETQLSLPSEEIEEILLKTSQKRIIKSSRHEIDE